MRGVLSATDRTAAANFSADTSEMPDRDMREMRIGNDEAIAANEAVKPRVDAIGARAVVRVLQNQLRPDVAHLEHAFAEMIALRETNLMHLKALPLGQTHALLAGEGASEGVRL